MQPLPEAFPECILGLQPDLAIKTGEAYSICYEISCSANSQTALAGRVLGWMLMKAPPSGRDRLVEDIINPDLTKPAEESGPVAVATNMKNVLFRLCEYGLYDMIVYKSTYLPLVRTDTRLTPKTVGLTSSFKELELMYKNTAIGTPTNYDAARNAVRLTQSCVN
jgi:hypothetical protein